MITIWRTAYLHVLADALTSVLTITGLAGGPALRLVWMDPAMGIVGALVIAHWSLGVLRSSGSVLLDTVPDTRLAAQLKSLEQGTDGWQICMCGSSPLA